MVNSLIKMCVNVKLSEPWDLGEARNWEPFEGVIINENFEGIESSIIIQLKASFEYKNVKCEYFVASPRYVGDSFEALIKSKSVVSGLTRIPPEQISASDPFDLSWWRGGVALLGEVVLSK
ncbi:MAG: hypothetical protein GY797_28625 [Deltaproteobacteria bacterium]|nr:hypothetical protein [Deltaproteobacteria bacterium]